MAALTPEIAKTWCTLPSSFMLFSSHPRYDEIVNKRTWALSVFGTHREADSVVRSNWQVLMAELEKKPELKDQWEVTHATCSLVGWRDHLTIQVFADDGSLTPMAHFIHAISEKLEAYPILNDDHHSAMELEENEAYWSEELKLRPAAYGWKGEEFTDENFDTLASNYMPNGFHDDTTSDEVRRAVVAYQYDLERRGETHKLPT